MRITRPLLKVLAVLEESAPDPVYGLDIIRRTGLASGTVYPTLDRLSAARWVVGEWEDNSGGPERRGPRRKFYAFTDSGLVEARQVLFEHGVSGARAWAW